MMNKLNVFTFLIILYSVVVCMTVKHNDDLKVVVKNVDKDSIQFNETNYKSVTQIARVGDLIPFQAAK